MSQRGVAWGREEWLSCLRDQCAGLQNAILVPSRSSAPRFVNRRLRRPWWSRQLLN